MKSKKREKRLQKPENMQRKTYLKKWKEKSKDVLTTQET